MIKKSISFFVMGLALLGTASAEGIEDFENADRVTIKHPTCNVYVLVNDSIPRPSKTVRNLLVAAGYTPISIESDALKEIWGEGDLIVSQSYSKVIGGPLSEESSCKYTFYLEKRIRKGVWASIYEEGAYISDWRTSFVSIAELCMKVERLALSELPFCVTEKLP